jgi:hypothetical protein
MKIEIDDNCFWLYMSLGIVLIISSLVILLVYINHLNEKQYIEHGYTRKTLVGTYYPQWVKE